MEEGRGEGRGVHKYLLLYSNESSHSNFFLIILFKIVKFSHLFLEYVNKLP